MFGQVAYAES